MSDGELTHMLNLTFGVSSPTQFDDAYGRLAKLHDEANKGGSQFPYISMYSSVIDDENEQQPGEDLYYDVHTMQKVHEAIKNILANQPMFLGEQVTLDIISEIQNAGILFRERR